MKTLLLLIVFIFVSNNSFAQLNPQPFESNPVVPIGASGTWDDSALWWSCVTVVNDTFYLVYNGTGNWPSEPASIGLATSHDGFHFTKSLSNPIVAADGSGFDAYAASGGTLHFENGIWYLYYSGKSTSQSQPGNVIGRASANNPHGPWTQTNDTLLTVGSTGEWDDEFLSPQSILFTDNGLVMYYWAGESWPNPNAKIGMATSTDEGITWQKYDDPATTNTPYAESDPVLIPGSVGSYDDNGIWGCSVLMMDGKWEMIYGGDSGSKLSLSYATSENGIVWEKDKINPLLNPDQDPLASNTINGPGAVFWNNTYFVYYSHGVNNIGISLATSERYINVPDDFRTIQGAINDATDGDVVLVDEGTYFENINYKGKAITVASHFILDQDTSHISKTIIDGSQPADPNKASVVTLNSGEDTTSVICGFTITGGTGTLVSNWEWRAGGGIFTLNSGVRITNNIIENNFLTSTNTQALGGGINVYLGFTIIENNIIRNNHIEASNNFVVGGGVLLQASGRIDNNTIINNKASYTGGSDHYCVGGGVSCISNTSNIFVSIHDNFISDNQVNSTTQARGGGLDLIKTNTKFAGNIISKNRTNGAFYNSGSGMSIILSEVSTVIDNNVFSYNGSENGNYTAGGGLYISNSSPVISNNTFKGNQARYGGGIATEYGAPKIIKNILVHNKADSIGGGVALWNEEEGGVTKQHFSHQVNNHAIELVPSQQNKTELRKSTLSGRAFVINNTFTGNSADSAGGALMTKNMDVEILNTILWDNSADKGAELWVDNADVSISYSDIQGGWQGTGNMDGDPLFSDSLYHLGTGSPCEDKGHPDLIYNDEDESRNDMGAYGGVTDSLLITDLDEVGDWKNLPEKYVLTQNYPNPFNPTTTINYSVPTLNHVDLSIYNLLGQKLATLVSQKQNVGSYKVEWNATGFSSGVYFYKLDTGSFVKVRKCLLIK